MLNSQSAVPETVSSPAPSIRLTLEDLGYEDFQMTLLCQAMVRPVGLVIIAGTCGSGVTTTLHTLLLEKASGDEPKNKCVRVVDTAEHAFDQGITYTLSGASAAERVRSESAFALAIKSAMRSDPDCVYFGKVRDDESARAMVEMVKSGHQILTEIHASGAMDIIARLRSIGIKDDVLGGQNFISALVYQTLLAVVCPHCAMNLDEAKQCATKDYEKEQIGRIERHIHPNLHAGLRFRREAGCDQCHDGVIGRTSVAEVIIPDDVMRQCFSESRVNDAFLHYRKQGGYTSQEHGVSKAIRGIVDLREVEGRLDHLTVLGELDDALNGRRESSSEPFVIKVDPFAQHTLQPGL